MPLDTLVTAVRHGCWLDTGNNNCSLLTQGQTPALHWTDDQMATALEGSCCAMQMAPAVEPSQTFSVYNN
jgi:hypothetical protein